MNSNPLVSSVVIFLNAERFIEEAIESVFRQTYDNWELLLVDDGSADASIDIALRYAERYPDKVRYLEHPGHQNRGMSATRNLGIANARGKYIAFLDSDDVWLPHKLEQQVAILESYPEAGMVYGLSQYWHSWTGNPEDSQRDFVPELGVQANTLFKPPTLLTLLYPLGNATAPCPSDLLFRCEVVERVGGFEESFTGMYQLYDDQAFLTKVYLNESVFVASKCWDRYRQHPEQCVAVVRGAGQYHSVRWFFLNWLKKYLVKEGAKDAKVWNVLQKALRPYRWPVEILKVSQLEVDPPLLWGHFIERPKAGVQLGSPEFEIVGRVRGRSCPVVAVELVHQGAVFRRVPVNHSRPNLTPALPHLPDAERGDFRTIMSLPGIDEFELGVQAVLQDQSRVPIGTIRGRRRWGEEDERVGAALVSVIIPCYNQARFLGEAIESVLAQTYPHFEIVVIDDGSTDNTQEVAARYPGTHLVCQENQGLAAARNTGLRHSKGEYLVFLDADDRLLPDALEAGLKCLREHPECAFVSGHCRFIAIDGSPLATPPQLRGIGRDLYVTLLSRKHFVIPGAVMYQRFAFESMSWFDSAVNGAADYDLYFRIARTFPVYWHDKVVLDYRKHGTNMTRNSAFMLKDTVAVLRSQRRYAKKDKRYKEAYRTGIKAGQEEYGVLLENEVRAHVRKREWKQALRSMLVLLRYYPRGLASVLSAYLQPWAAFGLIQRRIQELDSVPKDGAGYKQVIQRIREVASAALPPETTVVVVGKEDNEVLKLDDRPVWHLPHTASGEQEKLFAEGKEGSQEAPWIFGGKEYEFRLYADTERKRLLDSVKVTRSEEDSPEDSPAAASDQEAQSISGEAFIKASPNPVATQGQLGKTAICWDAGEEGTWGQVYVSKDGGPEKLFAGGTKGSQEAPWIQPNATYEFRLYAGKEHRVLLDSVEVKRSGAAFVMASPNPVLAGAGPGTTKVSWSTGEDGEWGQVYVSVADGEAGGYYPSDSAEAIVQLEELREKGAEFLLFPKTAMWWLEHYPEFRRHLEKCYREVVRQEGACLIQALHEPKKPTSKEK